MFKLHPINLPPLNKSRSISDVFIADADEDRKAQAGILFIIAEIESASADDIKILNLIINDLPQIYYFNDKISIKEQIGTVTIENILESSLSDLNKRILAFAADRGFRVSSARLNVTAAVMHDTCLCFSTLGKNQAYLFIKSPSENENSYRPININAISSDENSQIESQFFNGFSNVISGHMPSNSFAIFANEALFEYISVKQLGNIITTLPPLSATEQLKNSLSAVNSYVPFLGVIIKKFSRQNQILSKKNIPVVSHHISSKISLSHLSSTEKSTEKLLSPSGTFHFAKFIHKINAIIRAKRWPYGAWQVLKGLAAMSAAFIRAIFSNSIIKKFHTGSNRSKTSAVLAPARPAAKTIGAQKFSRFQSKIFSFFKNFQWRHKISIAAVIVLILIFTQNISRLNDYNLNKKNLQIYNDQRSQIEQKFNQIESADLYGNNDLSKNLLNEIEQLIGMLPAKIALDQPADIEDIKLRWEKYNNSIRKISKIKSGEEILNMEAADSQIRAQHLYLAENILYALDFDRRKGIKILIDSNIATPVEFPAASSSFSSVTINEKDGLIAFDGSDMFSLSPEETQAEIIDFSAEEAIKKQIISLKTYHSRIYSLCPAANQIYRHNSLAQKSGFGAAAEWIKDDMDIRGAADFAIDDSIYILTNSGEILKMLLGKTSQFNIEPADPPLANPAKIMLSSDKKFIFLFDRINRRLIAYDKNGKFIKQYYFEQDLADIEISSETASIYYIAGESIFKIPAEHLE